jgi:protein-tyrosine phosphatase
MPSVLFVCTANQFRSPLAAACLIKNLGQENPDNKWIIESAGTWTKDGLPAPDFTMQIAKQLELNGLESHLTRQINNEILDEFDLIIVMEVGHKEAIRTEFHSVYNRVYLLSEIADGIAYDIPDPATSDINPNEIGRELSALIAKGKDRLILLANLPS